jgi:hypothetical protein
MIFKLMREHHIDICLDSYLLAFVGTFVIIQYFRCLKFLLSRSTEATIDDLVAQVAICRLI